MTRRSTLQHTLTATLAASVLIASPAVAKPAGEYKLPDGVRSSSLAGTPEPRQDLRMPDRRDAAEPGQPTWPVSPEPLTKPAVSAEAPSRGGDDGDSIWLILGVGLGSAGIVAGSAAGLNRRARVRARRVAA